MNTKKILLTLLALSGVGVDARAQLINSNPPTTDSLKNVKSLQDGSRIGRTSGSKAPEFQELYDYEQDDKSLANAMFPYQQLLHRAYVIMLAEQRILSREEAREILGGLRKVDQLAQHDPALRLYLPYEGALIKEIGSVGGKMHIGRSRNDLDNTTNRMFLRDRLLSIIQSIIGFREALLDKAADNLETVMVVYTHRKEAQPITLAHYLTAIDEALGKSLDRYIDLYGRIDQSPLGSGASGGSSWPLDRKRVAELLGFQELVTNTIEGVAGWDHIAEFAADNAIYMTNVSRLASEIQLWSSDEYRMVELDNSFAGISSMMPQKKNPDALERSRKSSALTMGQLVSILTSLNTIEYQHSGVRYPLDPRSLEAVLAATHAMTGLVRTLHLNKDVMLRYAKQNFSTMTDLADLLVRAHGLDFRSAHELIALVVNEALAVGKTADQISVNDIDELARKYLNRSLSLTSDELQTALDPLKSINRKTGTGHPSPSSVKSMIDAARKDIHKKRAWVMTKTDFLQQTASRLNELIRAYK